jgi:hypothetical protein
MIFTTTAPVNQLYFPDGEDLVEIIITHNETKEVIMKLEVRTFLPPGQDSRLIIYVSPARGEDQFTISTIQGRQYLTIATS